MRVVVGEMALLAVYRYVQRYICRCTNAQYIEKKTEIFKNVQILESKNVKFSSKLVIIINNYILYK